MHSQPSWDRSSQLNLVVLWQVFSLLNIELGTNSCLGTIVYPAAQRNAQTSVSN
jgi:hypothetical protein